MVHVLYLQGLKESILFNFIYPCDNVDHILFFALILSKLHYVTATAAVYTSQYMWCMQWLQHDWFFAACLLGGGGGEHTVRPELSTGWRPCFIHLLFTTNLVTCHATEINKAHLPARRRRAP